MLKMLTTLWSGEDILMFEVVIAAEFYVTRHVHARHQEGYVMDGFRQSVGTRCEAG
jgi:hypothetical protein